jgi:hypothetical protein
MYLTYSTVYGGVPNSVFFRFFKEVRRSDPRQFYPVALTYLLSPCLVGLLVHIYVPYVCKYRWKHTYVHIYGTYIGLV